MRALGLPSQQQATTAGELAQAARRLLQPRLLQAQPAWQRAAAAGRRARAAHRTAAAPVAVTAAPPDTAASSAPRPPKQLAVFVSGGGSNFRAIHESIRRGRINAEVAVVVSNAPSCGGCAYATEHGIPTLRYPAPKSDPTAGLSADALVAELQQRGVDFVILAGYMKLVPRQLVAAFRRATLNIHPGLLPAFGGQGMYGSRVHAAVIASGARVSGPTVHFVDEEYDTGPILAQAAVQRATLWGSPALLLLRPPLADPRGARRAAAAAQEHELYPRCVAALVEGRITWREDGVPIAWTAH
eukprot:scaffold9.g3047.t1